jgi:thymidylate kinase
VRARLRGVRGKKTVVAGGAVIAFTGPDATGKSTLVQETSRWLGRVFHVRTGHLGRPPSTWLTWLPNVAKWLLRLVRPGAGPGPLESEGQLRRNPGLLYRIRAVCLAWERRALAIRLHREAKTGALVICDRYPSAIVGAMDGARLATGEGGFLARLEHRLYRDIPPPDVLIQLTTSVDVALERNRQRSSDGKAEDDGYLRQRHTKPVLPRFANAVHVELDTSRSREDTIAAARRIVWDML